jgi:hypothetical protein
MASEMLLVSKEKWSKLQKEVQDFKSSRDGIKGNSKDERGGDGKLEGPSDSDVAKPQSEKKTEKEQKTPFEWNGTYEELLSKLVNDMKGRVPHITSGGGGGRDPTDRVTKKKKMRKTKKPIKVVIPPPGVPDNWTPVAKDTDTRDLSKKPPYITNWEAY